MDCIERRLQAQSTSPPALGIQIWGSEERQVRDAGRNRDVTRSEARQRETRQHDNMQFTDTDYGDETRQDEELKLSPPSSRMYGKRSATRQRTRGAKRGEQRMMFEYTKG